VDREWESQRGGGGRDLGRDRGFGYSFGGGYAYEARYRSPSPPPGTIPLNKRPRKATRFDIPPAGYENVSAEQAKATGQFLLPCHKAVAKMAPGNMVPPGGAGYRNKENYNNNNMMNTLGLTPHQLRQQRRLYVGNLPVEVNEVRLGLKKKFQHSFVSELTTISAFTNLF
jgi:splicing factor U2AF subunit